MSLVRLVGVTRYYGARRVFGPLDLEIAPQARIGVVGPNGSGKSTLLALLAGEEPDRGEVYRARRLRVGFLRQEAPAGDATPVFAYVAGAFASLAEVEEGLRRLEKRMGEADVLADPAALDEVMAAYARLQSEFEQAGGYEREARVRSALFGLGIGEELFERPMSELSGGELARARLARVLLEQPDLLLLDEPTNHLDLAALEWLEDRLKRFEGALVLVSHDRMLLDAVTATTWELEGESVVEYPAPFTPSRVLARARRERLEKEFSAAQAERERLEAYVRKYRAGSRASQAKSREKRLERMEEAPPPPPEPIRAVFTVPRGPASEKMVLTLEELACGYGGDPVVAGIDLEIKRGDRIGIAGPNGAGKSTLIKTLAGEIPPVSGRIIRGRGVNAAYFSQTRTDLDPARTVLDEALDQKRQKIGEARSFLARFLFRGDDVFKPVEVLSGGEKSRLSLAKLLLHGGNLLLLDEPTNHLDLWMKEALEEALAGYDGTLVFVTHDRALLRAFADVVWWVDKGRLEVFDGYDALADKLAAGREASGDGGGTPGARQGAAGPGARGAKEAGADGKRGRPARPKAAASSRARREWLAAQQELEAEIEQLTTEKAELETALADPSTYADPEQAASLSKRYAAVEARLEACERAWLEAAEALEALEALEEAPLDRAAEAGTTG